MITSKIQKYKVNRSNYLMNCLKNDSNICDRTDGAKREMQIKSRCQNKS